ncbi:MAG: outer membrane protein, partial [Methylocystis sp.]
MKYSKIAISLILLSSTSVLAADLPSIKSTAVEPAPLWTGFYAGLNAGYGFGISSNAQNGGWANPSYFQNSLSVAAYAGASSWMGRGIVQNGFIGGAQAGYNYQVLNSLMIGLETDIQGAGIRGTGDANGLAPSSSNSYSRNNNTLQSGIDWMGTVRGRVGYLITPSTMVYATGGLAYGEAFLNTFPSTAGNTYTGLLQGVYGTGFLTTQNARRNVLAGWTAGAGAEWMFSPHWSLKGEALFYDLGNQAVNNTQYSGYAQEAGVNPVGGSLTRAYYSGVIARLGLNYHLSTHTLPEGPGFLQKDPTKNLVVSSNTFSTWSGIYAGLN